jgi:hypothetical protein
MSDTRVPPSPFSAAGKASGKSAQELRDQGLDPNGHPAASEPKPAKSAGGGVSRPAGSRGQSIAQLAGSIGDMELANQTDLHAYCEAIRKVLNYFAVSNELAKGQLKAASRQLARQSAEGRLTLVQQAELAKALLMLSRDLDGVTRACIAGAASAVKAWRRFDSFLVDLDKGAESKFNRPGGRRGGFTVV